MERLPETPVASRPEISVSTPPKPIQYPKEPTAHIDAYKDQLGWDWNIIFWWVVSIAVIIASLGLLLLFLHVVVRKWESIMANLYDLQQENRQIKKDLVELREAVNELRAWARQCNEQLARLTNQPRLVARVAEPATATRYDDTVRTANLGRVPLPHDPVQKLIADYQEALLDLQPAKAFIEKWGVFGLAKPEGQSGNISALVRVADDELQRCSFWAVAHPGKRGALIVLPGRHHYIHAGSLGLDDGKAGERLLGQAFEIILGTGFNLRRPADAEPAPGGTTIVYRGQLEVPK